MAFTGVSSVSFDYSGVNGSGASLQETSLQSRVEESVCVAEWMKEHINVRRYAVYGASMGGYVALGLVHEKPDMFENLILHAPAAYSPDAHDVYFGEAFTREIRRVGGWDRSFSFGWLANYKKRVLFIEAENDKIIPSEIIEKYKLVKKGDGNFHNILLKGSGHNIWDDTTENIRFRNEIYTTMKNFVGV